MKNTTMNLCNTCECEIPTCESKHDDVKYGNGKGNDNIIECKSYRLKRFLSEVCCPNCGCETFAEHDFGKWICCKCFDIY